MNAPSKSRALLLVNMGGPENLGQVSGYLRSVFRDPAILPLPALIRHPLAALISSRRTDKVSERYRLIGGASPLLHWTRLLRDGVAAALKEDVDDTTVAFAFRYASPTIAEALSAIRKSGAKSVNVVPLFPHYTEAMSGSVAPRGTAPPSPGRPGWRKRR
jgi:protoporphyrin/coproporphyrin ferrochelatase